MPKKRGGQKGNKNALKHGIYSKFILLAHDAALKGMSDTNVKDDLAMARVKFATAMNKQADTADLKDWLSVELFCYYWLSKIMDCKLRIKEVDQVAGSVFEDFMDAVRAANDRQNFKWWD